MCSTDSAISSVIAARQSAVNSQIAYAVAAKKLQATKQQGDAAAQLLEAAVQLGKAVGKGRNFDAVG